MDDIEYLKFIMGWVKLEGGKETRYLVCMYGSTGGRPLEKMGY